MPLTSNVVNILPAKALSGLKSLSTGWSLLGPSSMPDQSLGLTKAVAVDMTDPNYNIIFVGSQTGGLWKTTNGGMNWTNVTDVLNKPGLGINSVVIDPNNHNIVYIATDGSGIFKSTDAGSS